MRTADTGGRDSTASPVALQKNKLERADVRAGVERKSLAISSNGIVLWCRRRIGRVPITDAGRKGAAVVVTGITSIQYRGQTQGLVVLYFGLPAQKTKVPRTSEFVRPASHGWNQADGFPRILHYPPSGSGACDTGIKMTRRAVCSTKGPTALPSRQYPAGCCVQCIAHSYSPVNRGEMIVCKSINNSITSADFRFPVISVSPSMILPVAVKSIPYSEIRIPLDAPVQGPG